jgi:spore coat polysaccharide biosynthesis protein SpsF
MKRRLVAALACRNKGSRLYGKPLQNLDVNGGIRIIDCLRTIESIDEVVLGISEGSENQVFKDIARQKGLNYIVGDQIDVLSRLIQCGQAVNATDIFRVTSESPFLYFDPVDKLWLQHQGEGADATFMDDIIDGCGFEIISLDALKQSHSNGVDRHRSEHCSSFIRDRKELFRIIRKRPPEALIRKDLRLTVDNPEDLVVCRAVFNQFKMLAPRIPLAKVVEFLDESPDLIKLVAPFTGIGYSTMYK